MAYGLIGSGDRHPSTEAEVIPITLDLIDASSVPLQSLVALRKRERSERRGEDYSKLRHNYADMVQNQVAMLGAACDQFERDELTRQFRARMKTDLNHLRNELGGNKIDLVLKPVVVATLFSGRLVSERGASWPCSSCDRCCRGGWFGSYGHREEDNRLLRRRAQVQS